MAQLGSSSLSLANFIHRRFIVEGPNMYNDACTNKRVLESYFSANLFEGHIPSSIEKFYLNFYGKFLFMFNRGVLSSILFRNRSI